LGRWIGPGGPNMDGSIEQQTHHFFLLEPEKPLPDRWDHMVAGDGVDKGMRFQFKWVDVQPGLEEQLAFGSGACLDALVRESSADLWGG